MMINSSSEEDSDSNSSTPIETLQNEKKGRYSTQIKRFGYVTIKDILDCTDDKVKIKTFTIDVVEFVGRVKSVKLSSDNIRYTFIDPTGKIYAFKDFVSGNNVSLNGYYTVRGHIQCKNGIRYIDITEINEVSDFRQIIDHILRANFAPVGELPIKYFESMNDSTLSDMDPLFKHIYDIIANDDSFEGLSVFDIAAEAAFFAYPKISEALNFLCDHGYIRKTFDDHHYQSAF